MTVIATPEPATQQLPKARALASLFSDDESHTFISASCSETSSPNELFTLVYNAKSSQISITGSSQLNSPLIHLETAPDNSNLLSGVSKSGRGREAAYTVFTGKLCGSSDASSSFEFSDLGTVLDRPTGLVMRSIDQVVVATLSELSFLRVDSDRSGAKLPVANCNAIAQTSSIDTPLAFSSDRSLCLWDPRSSQVSLNMKTCHFFPILSLDANPNLDYMYATGGADGRIMFWDIRQANGSNPLKVTSNAHAHHVTSVRYHPVHDQLLISSGTDCAVNLWLYQSVSSSPSSAVPLTSPRPKKTEPVADELVQSYRHHEDSVYRCCWSREGWAFASVSYDGLVMVNSVPTTEKYRIMV